MKYTVRIDDHDYEVTITDLHARPIAATVDGVAFEVQPADVPAMTVAAYQAPVPTPAGYQPAAAPRPAATFSPAAPISTGPRLPSQIAGDTVRAPIPGVIQSILVKAGDTVSRGEALFIIEAMKMKNTIRANRDGVIAEVLTTPGATVNHGAPILSFGVPGGASGAGSTGATG